MQMDRAVLVMWSEKLILSSIPTPRFLAVFEGVIFRRDNIYILHIVHHIVLCFLFSLSVDLFVSSNHLNLKSHLKYLLLFL